VDYNGQAYVGNPFSLGANYWDVPRTTNATLLLDEYAKAGWQLVTQSYVLFRLLSRQAGGPVPGVKTIPRAEPSSFDSWVILEIVHRGALVR
jgi:hypothetical protein